MKKRKTEFARLVQDVLEDGKVDVMEKIELEHWLHELDPPPSADDIIVLKRAIFDDVVSSLKHGQLKLPAYKAVQGIDKINNILYSYLSCVPKEVVEVESSVLEAHFDDKWAQVSGALDAAESTIDIATYTLSYDPMRDLLIHMAGKGVNIRILTEDGTTVNKGSDVHSLADINRITVRIDGPNSTMHHKFIIVDNRIVLNGSMNFTNLGIHNNDENVLVVNHREIVNGFSSEFSSLWEIAFPLT